MRRPSSSRYDIVTSAAAWSQIGTLDSGEFHDLQAELDRLAWGASHMKTGPATANFRGVVKSDGLLANYELDHIARRVTVLSVRRMDAQEREQFATERGLRITNLKKAPDDSSAA
ncbi:MAG: hypothetical protein ACJ790_23030 [Myxococcaceae bacterium]